MNYHLSGRSKIVSCMNVTDHLFIIIVNYHLSGRSCMVSCMNVTDHLFIIIVCFVNYHLSGRSRMVSCMNGTDHLFIIIVCYCELPSFRQVSNVFILPANGVFRPANDAVLLVTTRPCENCFQLVSLVMLINLSKS